MWTLRPGEPPRAPPLSYRAWIPPPHTPMRDPFSSAVRTYPETARPRQFPRSPVIESPFGPEGLAARLPGAYAPEHPTKRLLPSPSPPRLGRQLEPSLPASLFRRQSGPRLAPRPRLVGKPNTPRSAVHARSHSAMPSANKAQVRARRRDAASLSPEHTPSPAPVPATKHRQKPPAVPLLPLARILASSSKRSDTSSSGMEKQPPVPRGTNQIRASHFSALIIESPVETVQVTAKDTLTSYCIPEHAMEYDDGGSGSDSYSPRILPHLAVQRVVVIEMLPAPKRRRHRGRRAVVATSEVSVLPHRQ